MPAATNVTINNGAAVAKNFVLLTPASGDGSSALWALKEGAISSVFPTIEESARRNAKGDARKCSITLKLPSYYTVAATGLTAVGSAAVFNCTATIPNDFPEVLKDDFAAFAKNVLANTLLNACIRDALPAT